jgi:hypothetical protein
MCLSGCGFHVDAENSGTNFFMQIKGLNECDCLMTVLPQRRALRRAAVEFRTRAVRGSAGDRRV